MKLIVILSAVTNSEFVTRENIKKLIADDLRRKNYMNSI